MRGRENEDLDGASRIQPLQILGAKVSWRDLRVGSGQSNSIELAGGGVPEVLRGSRMGDWRIWHSMIVRMG